MQNILRKFLIIISFCCYLPQIMAQNTEEMLLKADNEFERKKFSEATKGYTQILQAGEVTASMLLKQAMVAEQQQKFVDGLYYLQLAYSFYPKEEILQKIMTIAEEKQLKGHKPTDIEYMFFVFHRFEKLLTLGFVAIMLASSLFLWYRIKYKLSDILFPTILVLLLIVPFLYLYNFGFPSPKAIVKADKALCMDFPSAGANLRSVVTQGNCVKILDKVDIWYKVSYDGEVGYVREHNLWVIQ
jgi:hypothetical protein